MKLTRFATLLALLMLVAPAHAQAPKPDPESTLIIELKTGKVTIAMRPDLAPKHVQRVKDLARAKFYDGLVFHRVIDGFMAQTGDPTGTGKGGSGRERLPLEASAVPFERGTIGAARGPSRDSADSQFFIIYRHSPHLNGDYTVWGRVVDGMAHIDQLRKGDPGTGLVADPDRMLKVYVLADEKK